MHSKKLNKFKKGVEIMNKQDIQKFIAMVEEESKSVNKGDISHSYVVGVLGSLLTSAFSESSFMRDATKQVILDKIEEL